MQRVESYRSLR